jgi:polar amino acid transport system substrate-binding protein
VAISLKSNNFKIENLNDIKGKTIVSFQGASKFMGKDFSDAVAGNPKYSESANEDKKQSNCIRMAWVYLLVI